MCATRTDKTGHVLDDAEHADAGFAAEINFLADVEQADFLGGGHHYGATKAGFFEVGIDAKMLVAGSGGSVNEEVVERAPFDVFKELLDQTIFFGSAPDHGVVSIREHELDAHHAEVVSDPDRTPPRVADMDCLRLYAHHFRDAWPADVCVHDPHHVICVGSESVCKHGGKCGLADTAFATQYEDLVLNTGETRGDEGNIGIGALWRGGTDGLVRTTSAGIALARKFRFGSGTVLLETSTRFDKVESVGNLPGSGATNLGAAFNGALRST